MWSRAKLYTDSNMSSELNYGSWTCCANVQPHKLKHLVLFRQLPSNPYSVQFFLQGQFNNLAMLVTKKKRLLQGFSGKFKIKLPPS